MQWHGSTVTPSSMKMEEGGERRRGSRGEREGLMEGLIYFRIRVNEGVDFGAGAAP